MAGQKNEKKQANTLQVKKKPGAATPQAPRVILPPWPGYPLLGCSAALPNSVSPGNLKPTMKCRLKMKKKFKTSQTRPPAPDDNKPRKILIITPCQMAIER
jgi:hypothetical protein